MGRFLDIAQAVPLVETALAKQTVKRIQQLDAASYQAEAEHRRAVSDLSAVNPVAGWSQPAADVLDILVKTDAPIEHAVLMAALAEKGHGKAAAYKAIADVQGLCWIEHNLMTGYVLS